MKKILSILLLFSLNVYSSNIVKTVYVFYSNDLFIKNTSTPLPNATNNLNSYFLNLNKNKKIYIKTNFIYNKVNNERINFIKNYLLSLNYKNVYINSNINNYDIEIDIINLNN